VPTTRASFRPAAIAVFVASVLSVPLGCGEGESGARPEAVKAEASAPASAAAAQPAQTAAPAPGKPATPTAAPRREPPLPSFEGVTLDGRAFAARDLLGKRALLFFFNPDVPEAGPAADAVARVAKEADANNFAVVAVALGAGGSRAREFAKQHGLEIPIVDDGSGAIAGRVQLRAPVALIGVDGDGYVTFFHGGIGPGDVPDAADVVETELRESLRLPALAGASLEPALGTRAPAPPFSMEPLGGGEKHDSKSLAGKPYILIFFLYTCPHCHHALEFLKTELAKLPEATRPKLVGISVGGAASAVTEKLKADGLDFFPVYVDDGFKVRTAFGVMAGVPDIFVVDADGGVATRVQGWRDDRDPALMRMWLAKLSGGPVPMLLHASGYSGSEACAVCHDKANATWQLTQHATAFDTLVRHSAAARTDCVGCHVVGFDKPGGYTISPPAKHLENVGCEDCHGRGGPHLSPEFVKGGDYKPVCLTCHDQKHSLGFDYATFLPQISHAANAQYTSLPLAEKQKLLAKRGATQREMLPTTAAYVGSEACQPCHAKEFETWSQQPHAHAVATLEKKGDASKGECLACHTTAYGRPGGFPKDGKPAEHTGLANVGCEACHGPGGDHVGPDAPRVGTIVSLTDKCGSCVILQICGTCHDEANDPGFEFAVEKKIEAQKHGTITPAALKEIPPAAAREVPSASWVGSLERGFSLSDGPG
jgi:peroxiredoxin